MAWRSASRSGETSVARVSTYLNFNGTTEAAFNFYKAVFGSEFLGPIARFADVPLQPGQPEFSDEAKQLVMNVALPILDGHVIMGTDVYEPMGTLIQGNNVSICLDPDSREETERLFNALAAGGKIEMPLTDMFWGDYYGSLTDQYGTQWMFNFSGKS
jgi:PhnB protein